MTSSIAPCASWGRACGTGRRSTRIGSRASRGKSWPGTRARGTCTPPASGSRRSRGVPPKGAERSRALVGSSRAVIAGDTLVDFGRGFEIPLVWLGEDVTRQQIAEGLRPLLEPPVEHVLATHGGPTDRAAPRARALLTSDLPRHRRSSSPLVPTRSANRGFAPLLTGTHGPRALAGSPAAPGGCDPGLVCSSERVPSRLHRTTPTSSPRDRLSSGRPGRRCRGSESAPAAFCEARSSSSSCRLRGGPRRRRKAASVGSRAPHLSRPPTTHQNGSRAKRVRSRRGVAPRPVLDDHGTQCQPRGGTWVRLGGRSCVGPTSCLTKSPTTARRSWVRIGSPPEEVRGRAHAAAASAPSSRAEE